MKIMNKVIIASLAAVMFAGCASSKAEVEDEVAAAEETVIEQVEEAAETVQTGIGYEK